MVASVHAHFYVVSPVHYIYHYNFPLLLHNRHYLHPPHVASQMPTGLPTKQTAKVFRVIAFISSTLWSRGRPENNVSSPPRPLNRSTTPSQTPLKKGSGSSYSCHSHLYHHLLHFPSFATTKALVR